VLESPITIHDADHPIGTHIYTVLDYANGGANLRWSAVSMDSRQLGQSGRHTAEPASPDLAPARAALDPVEIPRDIVDRISEIISSRCDAMIRTFTAAMIDSMTARMGRLMRLHLIVAAHLYRGSCDGVQTASEGADTLSQ
jgi:hypothetical protein